MKPKMNAWREPAFLQKGYKNPEFVRGKAQRSVLPKGAFKALYLLGYFYSNKPKALLQN